MLKKVYIRFDSAWVMSRQKHRMNPLEAFLNSFSLHYDISVLRLNMTECEFVVLNDTVSAQTVSDKIQEVLTRRFSLSYVKEIAHFEISDFATDADAMQKMEKWDRQAAIERSRKALQEAKEKEQLDADKPKQKKSIGDMLAEYKRSAAEKAKPEEREGEPSDLKTLLDAALAPDDDAQEAPAAVATEPETESVESVMEVINALVGAEEFKILAEELVKIAPGLIRHNTVETLTHQCYLFAINDGNGLSTYMNLLARLLKATGLVQFRGMPEVREERIDPPGAGGTRGAFGSALAALRKSRNGSKRLVCVDISEWMSNASDRGFREFLTQVDRALGDNIVIFRVPFVEQNVLQDLKKRIADVLFVREVAFVPFECDELVQCAKNELESRGFTMEEDAWQVYNARIAEEKSDGRFYGINTVRKVVREMIYRKQLDNACNGVDDTLIKKMEILGLAPSYDSKEVDGLDALDGFIGMESIKKRIEEIVMQIEIALQNKELGSPCIHMRFVGNPGTGKTTVARVIGKVLKERGILRNGNFFEYGGRDFCGKYVGETAPKTVAMCRDAYGSVLFIDEAYTLYRGGEAGNLDYGREAIDTLIAQMENHRNDLVVIMAGYPDEMETLMSANPGLESRMPYTIEFPNYTRAQLFRIYMGMAKRNFEYTEEFAAAAEAYFNGLPDELLNSKEFSNARFVRNLFERTWGKAYTREKMDKQDAVTLEKEDFLLASTEKEFQKAMEKPSKRTLGFV